jgi:hypothetical protein
MSNSRRATPFSSASSPRPPIAAPGATDALVAGDRHDRSAEPSSGLLERLQLVLDGLAAITGRDPDIQGGASGQCCHAVRVSRIGNPSMEKNLGLGLIDVLITP